MIPARSSMALASEIETPLVKLLALATVQGARPQEPASMAIIARDKAQFPDQHVDRDKANSATQIRKAAIEAIIPVVAEHKQMPGRNHHFRKLVRISRGDVQGRVLAAPGQRLDKSLEPAGGRTVRQGCALINHTRNDHAVHPAHRRQKISCFSRRSLLAVEQQDPVAQRDTIARQTDHPLHHRHAGLRGILEKNDVAARRKPLAKRGRC